MNRRKFIKSGLVAGAAATATVAAPHVVVGAGQDLQLEDDQRLWPRRALLRAGPRQPDRLHQDGRCHVAGPPQDPALRGRRADPRAGGLRRCVEGHRRDELRQRLLLGRQDVCRAVFHRRAVRLQLPGHERLALPRRRHQAVGGGLRALQSGAHPDGQHRRADDRLVQEADREGRRLQGPEDAHSRARGPRLRAARRRREAAAGRRDLPGAGARRHRRGGVRRALSGSPSRPAEGGQVSTTPPAGTNPRPSPS